nr:MAG TPA: hypothetical protein [Bacteriophage sp.]
MLSPLAISIYSKFLLKLLDGFWTIVTSFSSTIIKHTVIAAIMSFHSVISCTYNLSSLFIIYITITAL